MRLGKMCGLLMKAFLAVLMLFATAAAVEVYWEDEFDEAIANQCESIILKEEYLNMDFGEAIVVDFDTVLDLDGHELTACFKIKDGAKMTIKNGMLNISAYPIIEVCGSDDEERPTVLILENLKSRHPEVSKSIMMAIPVLRSIIQKCRLLATMAGACKYPMQLREMRALIFSWMAVTYLVHKGMSLSAMVTRRFLLRMLSWAARPVF